LCTVLFFKKMVVYIPRNKKYTAIFFEKIYIWSGRPKETRWPGARFIECQAESPTLKSPTTAAQTGARRVHVNYGTASSLPLCNGKASRRATLLSILLEKVVINSAPHDVSLPTKKQPKRPNKICRKRFGVEFINLISDARI
jgi:hypothetical protein